MRKSRLIQIMLIVLVLSAATLAIIASLPDVNEAAIIRPTPWCSNCATPIIKPTPWCILACDDGQEQQ